MIDANRKPSDSDKLQAPSLPEIKDAFTLAAKHLGRRIEFRGKRMGYGPLLNAVVIDFLNQPVARQAEIARAGIAVYEAALLSDEPGEPARPAWRTS